jgi:hypothetical protein
MPSNNPKNKCLTKRELKSLERNNLCLMSKIEDYIGKKRKLT